MSGDSGAVAVLVALLSVALFGFGAIVIDAGALYAERRDLQNGADAAALAVAQSCAATGCGTFDADANAFADANALDKASRITPGEVCGSIADGLPACVNPPAALIGTGYVQVTTRTEEAGGGLVVPPFLARVLLPDYTGTEVVARATAAWGPAGGIDAKLAITFSMCEYMKLTTDSTGGKVYATKPYAPALERIIHFHDTTQATGCPAGPSGSDLPGGFGWLDEGGNCEATIENGWVSDSTGASASKDCKKALEALVGQVILVPVFGNTNGLSGSNGQYAIVSYVGFVLTGWRFPSTTYASTYLPGIPCAAPQTCISGFFVEVAADSSGPIGTGPDTGVRVVQLIS